MVAAHTRRSCGASRTIPANGACAVASERYADLVGRVAVTDLQSCDSARLHSSSYTSPIFMASTDRQARASEVLIGGIVVCEVDV